MEKKEKKHNEKISDQENTLLQPVIHTEQMNERLEWLFNEISLLDKVDRSLTLLLLNGGFRKS